MAYRGAGAVYLGYAKKILSPQGTLMLQFTDKNDEEFFTRNNEQELQSLKQVIQNLIGKEMEIDIRTVSEKEDHLYEDITKVIQFDNIEYI